jgi:hypothetical protein
VNKSHTSRFTGPILPLRFNDRFRVRLSPSASGGTRERVLGPALAMAGLLPPYRHQREGIRQIAKIVNDTVRNTPEATSPDSNGNLEMTPLREIDGHIFVRNKERLTVRLVDEQCP